GQHIGPERGKRDPDARKRNIASACSAFVRISSRRHYLRVSNGGNTRPRDIAIMVRSWGEHCSRGAVSPEAQRATNWLFLRTFAHLHPSARVSHAGRERCTHS